MIGMAEAGWGCEWELIHEEYASYPRGAVDWRLSRLPVPGGWLVLYEGVDQGVASTTFVPATRGTENPHE